VNDPNYDDYDDFFGEDKAKKFLDEVFGPDDTNPCVIRNPGCKFTEKVLDYLFFEWMVDLINYSHDIQSKAMDLIDAIKKSGQNVPNTAAQIAMEILPITDINI
jgi:hypothetical protein